MKPELNTYLKNCSLNMNYGVFRAVQYANRKADGIIRALATYFENGEGKNEAEKELREIIKEYTENE